MTTNSVGIESLPKITFEDKGLTESQVKSILKESNQRSDVLMQYILWGYFAFGIFLSFFYDTWLIGIASGGICILAYYAIKALLPEGNLHRYVASGALAVFVAQYIYQMHGLFEMHFFAFIGTTILITYQNWRLMIPIISIVVIHHSAFAYLQYLGYEQIYFTQLSYMDLQTFIFHAGLAGAVTLISGYWAHIFRQKTIADGANILALEQQKEELHAQSDQLNVANKEIKSAQQKTESSINYAQRIQASMLPGTDRMRAAFQDMALLNKPRDLVSGDFYFYAEVEGRQIIAIMDCTGHGVPGAFMSVIGHNLLHEIVVVRQITKPDEILKRLDQGVIRILNQQNSKNLDGMDGTICTIDQNDGKLWFAGAKNPLVVVKDGIAKKHRGGLFPIGGVFKKREKVFRSTEIKLEEGQTFYLFSDGYQDQFSGKDGEKFKYKHFENLLSKIADLPGNEQEKKLNEIINAWMTNYRQTDDILVFGFKVKMETGI
jgi:serine phosphatase RsbU (regulator of sigma subunit)